MGIVCCVLGVESTWGAAAPQTFGLYMKVLLAWCLCCCGCMTVVPTKLTNMLGCSTVGLLMVNILGMGERGGHCMLCVGCGIYLGGCCPPDLWTLHEICTCLLSLLVWVFDFCVYQFDKHAWLLSSCSANGEKNGEMGARGWGIV